LSPSEEGNHPGFVPVVFEGAPSPLEQSRPEVVGRVLAFPAVAFVALAAVGELAMHSAPSSPGAATIAAATPLRRFEALAALRAQTSLSASPSDATLRDEASLDTLRGFYGMASDDYARANRPEEAATIAAHYGDPFRVARARFVNGEIAEAAKAFVSARARDPKLPITISEVTSYVLTDDFERAATGAHALLAQWDGPKGSQDELQCIVDAIDHRAGGSHDTGALERHAHEGATRVPCTLLMLDLRDGTGGASGDDTLSELRSDPHVRRYLEPLTHGTFGSCTFPASDVLGCWGVNDAFGPGMITDPKAIAFYLPQALALQAFQHTLSEVSSHGWRGADMALAASLYAATRTFLGDVEGALTILDVAGRAAAPLARRAETEERRRASLDPTQDPPFRHDPSLSDDLDLIRSTRAAVLLRRGRARDALRLQPSGMGARFSTLAHVIGAYDPMEQLALAAGDGRELDTKLWTAAYTGDGAVLVDALRASQDDGRGVVDVVAWHIPSGRAALASWVRYEYPAPCSTCGLYPLMNSLGSRLDAAHATGDEATVRELDAVRVRLDPYLARRQDALLVHFLSLLSPP
jgi:hypothetical protein